MLHDPKSPVRNVLKVIVLVIAIIVFAAINIIHKKNYFSCPLSAEPDGDCLQTLTYNKYIHTHILTTQFMQDLHLDIATCLSHDWCLS